MQYQIDPIAQRTERTCWEACGRMMWNWRYRNDPGRLSYYANKVAGWTELDRGLDHVGLRAYFKLLELRTLDRTRECNVRFALKWTPVVVAFRGTPADPGHIVVISGFDGRNYTVVDPQGGINMDPTVTDSFWIATATPEDKSSLDAGIEPFIFYW
jgi:ABC-type bacteriocin/lantibiotic exporter with double-glycine peptidase domain